MDLDALLNAVFDGDDAMLHQHVDALINAPTPSSIMTLNPKMTMQLLDGHIPKALFDESGLVVADSVGIEWAFSKRLGKKVTRFPGVDLTQHWLTKTHYTLYMVGGQEHLVHKWVATLPIAQQNRVLGIHHGFLTSQSTKTIIQDINLKKPDLILIGMGCPKQEQFMCQAIDQLNRGVLVGVGGSFDTLSGRISRAPKAIQRWRLEWLYRMCREPKRLKDIPAILRFIKRT